MVEQLLRELHLKFLKPSPKVQAKDTIESLAITQVRLAQSQEIVDYIKAWEINNS